MWMLGWRSLLVSMSTRRASAKARKVQRPSRLTVVMRANTVAHEPVASMRYPEKYTMRTPAEGDKVAEMRFASVRNKARPRICYEIFVSTETGRPSREHQSSSPLRFGLTPALLRSLDVRCGAKLILTDRKYSR